MQSFEAASGGGDLILALSFCKSFKGINLETNYLMAFLTDPLEIVEYPVE